ncbi:DUF1493 family protein [Filimonas effusa]|nr:DUF1493 family protein [Filimonas effusa]
MGDNIFNELVKFTIKQSCVDDEPIKRTTKLYEDLGIYGDDAVEFIIAFGKAFDVDVSEFKAADYFKGDGIDILGLNKNNKELTVGHLEKAILAGRLDEEVINF